MDKTTRDRAWRRAQRQRAIAHALPVMRRFFGSADMMTKALRWADNLRKCSYPMYKSDKWHDSRQLRRADAALRDQYAAGCATTAEP
jgi:hypothetical protein